MVKESGQVTSWEPCNTYDLEGMKSLGSDPKSLAGRPSDKSKLLGQILTPQDIANSMAVTLLRDRPQRPISILDPAVGPGTFPLALLNTLQIRDYDKIHMYDIDERMTELTRSNLNGEKLHTIVTCGDYLDSIAQNQYDFIILNPPYIRQEWIENKTYYRNTFKKRYGLKIPGTSNLYVYFLAKVIHELKPGGRLVCIIYDSWRFTKFGNWLESLIYVNCNSVETCSMNDQPFSSHLIDATIISAERKTTEFNVRPKIIKERVIDTPFLGVGGFKPIDELFQTKRGLRLKQASFFLCDLSQECYEGATHFVKKPGYIRGYHVPENHKEAALLISPRNNNPEVFNELSLRLSEAKKDPKNNVSILTWARERPETWHVHMEAPHAPIIFNYYLRNRPKHIYNPTRPYADNFYGLTPKSPVDPLAILALMNSSCVCVEIFAHARSQGNGLAKIQLYKYRRVQIPDWTTISNDSLELLKHKGEELLSCTSQTATEVLSDIDAIIAKELIDDRLEPVKIQRLYKEWSNYARNRR